MKLRFDPSQPHQLRALEAVRRLFGGQPSVEPSAATHVVGGTMVVGNRIALDRERLRSDMQALQRSQDLPVDDDLPDGVPRFAIEMETGTGKTYVFVRACLELARHHGLRKFIVVVPRVAIREGVLKTLRITRQHFAELYPELGVQFFAYDSARPERIRQFVRASAVQIAVLTIDAFNKATNVLRQRSDAFGGCAPLELVAATAPVVILDEPQHFDSELRTRALDDLAPLCTLRFGATHRRIEGLVHRLDPHEASARGLVKRVEIVPPPDASLAEPDLLSERIGSAIACHLERQAELEPRGIKVLSLLFVDRVAAYVDAEGAVRRAFDEQFERLKRGHPRFEGWTADQVRVAYFAEQRRRGVATAIDSRTGDTRADAEAYRLIMRDKERLLSLDEPVGFVFSHSALREGWDNPNVFQICTLTRSRSHMRRRQEVGRGVRLCVDVHGQRVLDPEVNVLRVFTLESYEAFVEAWRREGPGRADPRDDRPAPPRVGERSSGWPSLEPAPRRGFGRFDPDALLDDVVARLVDRASPGGGPGPLPDLVALVQRGLVDRGGYDPVGAAWVLALLERLVGHRALLERPRALAAEIVAAIAGALED